PGFWHMVRRFWPYIRKWNTLVAGSTLALVAEVGLRLLEPWPLKFVFDYVMAPAPGGGQSGIAAVDALDPPRLLLLSALAVAVITGLRALAAYTSTVGFALVGNRVLTDVRADLYRHLQRLSLSFHTRARGGDLTMRLIGDVGLLREVAATALLPLLGNALILVGMVAVMAWLNTTLALLALVIVPLLWLVTARIGRRIREVARRQRQREGVMAAVAAETIGAIKVVQALSLEDRFAATFDGQNDRSLAEGVRAGRLAASLERTTDVLIGLTTALVLWYGTLLVLGNALTPGDLLVFLTYLKNGFKPMRDLAKYTGRLAKATAAGERVLALLDQTPAVCNLPDATPAPPFHGAVRFAGVGFAYEPGQPVLEEIDLTIQPGQQVALVGPSGNGKSTLIGLILRLYDPVRGRIEIDGRDIRGYTLESLRAQISVVPQDTLLFAASIRDNIAHGVAAATPAAIEAAARLANAHGFIMALPDGYDTIVGERGVTLSTGQRQRLAIARAAVREAPVLILDEPTTGLDEVNERAVTDALARLMIGRTTVLITHDLRLASRADLIAYLDHGRIVERGAHADLLVAGGAYAALYRLQVATPHGPVAKERADAIAC
ncbi:MAG: ABC transporter ATP-binding protein, partial [Chloroflexi bacterium]|nr:ABC transporter ATP-binding protein [Chloroflexota bacterium]